MLSSCEDTESRIPFQAQLSWLLFSHFPRVLTETVPDSPPLPHIPPPMPCHSYLLQTIRQHMVSLTVTAFQVQGWHPHHCLHFTEILPSWWRHLAFWLTSPLKSLALTYFSFFTSILLSPASLISLLTSFWCRYSQVSSVSHWSLVTKC